MKINVNGIEMYYEKYGAGRPLILVHGNSLDHTEFKDSIWLLRKHFTVYAVDSRGHGLSTKVDELHYSDMARADTASAQKSMNCTTQIWRTTWSLSWSSLT